MEHHYVKISDTQQLSNEIPKNTNQKHITSRNDDENMIT